MGRHESTWSNILILSPADVHAHLLAIQFQVGTRLFARAYRMIMALSEEFVRYQNKNKDKKGAKGKGT